MKTTYTVTEIQQILKVSKPTAYGLVKKGLFSYTKFGNNIRISKESFDRWLAPDVTDEPEDDPGQNNRTEEETKKWRPSYKETGNTASSSATRMIRVRDARSGKLLRPRKKRKNTQRRRTKRS